MTVNQLKEVISGLDGDEKVYLDGKELKDYWLLYDGIPKRKNVCGINLVSESVSTDI